MATYAPPDDGDYQPDVSETVRQANARIADEAIRLRFVSRVPFICECGECDEFVLLHPADYKAQRSECVVAPGHAAAAERRGPHRHRDDRATGRGLTLSG